MVTRVKKKHAGFGVLESMQGVNAKLVTTKFPKKGKKAKTSQKPVRNRW